MIRLFIRDSGSSIVAFSSGQRSWGMYELGDSCEMAEEDSDLLKFRVENSIINRRVSPEARSRPTSLSGFTIPAESDYLPSANETIYLCNFRVSVDGDWLCLKELPDTVSTTVAGHQLRYEQMAITPELEKMTRYPNYPLHGKGSLALMFKVKTFCYIHRN